jgi:hypothetical protein
VRATAVTGALLRQIDRLELLGSNHYCHRWIEAVSNALWIWTYKEDIPYRFAYLERDAELQAAICSAYVLGGTDAVWELLRATFVGPHHPWRA